MTERWGREYNTIWRSDEAHNGKRNEIVIMKAENPTKEQHFVPQFYLKRFADPQGLIQVLDIKNNRLVRPRSSSGVGYAHYFYAAETGVPDEVSQHIEKWLQVYENTIAQELPKIIDKILNHKQIDDNHRYILSALMCMLWLRSPNMRTQLNRMHENMTKQVMRIYAPRLVDRQMQESGGEMPDGQREDFIKMLEDGSYKIDFNNVEHLQFMTKHFGFGGQGFINMFFGQKWKIYLVKGKKRFITTDSPVVEWWLPPQSFYGASFLERNKYFALTPEIFLELTYPIGAKKIKRRTIFENMDDEVMLFNILLANHAHEYAYSIDKASLENLISGREKPGAVEKTYYKRYELPWTLPKKEDRQ